MASDPFITIPCSLYSDSRLITSQALMVSTTITSLRYCSFCTDFITHRKSTSNINLSKRFRSLAIKANFHSFLTRPDHSCNSFSKNFIIQRLSDYGVPNLVSTRSSSSIVRSYNGRNESGGNPQPKDNGLDWPILRRWVVPWPWQTVSLSSLACGISFVVTGLLEIQALPYLGISPGDFTLDEKAELLFVDQSVTTAAVLGVLFSLTKTFQPLPDDLYRYDLREPFNLDRGWLLWAAIGLAGALGAIAVTGVATSFFSGENPQRETDALVRLLPLIGSSTISTVCLLGVTGVLAPLLEETVFRGFFMTSMTTWVPTPIAVVISSAVFALAHLTPGQFPQLFILGTALGLSYAQTRNLLTPITIHALWNSGVIMLLTFLQLQGYDIKELLQASQ